MTYVKSSFVDVFLLRQKAVESAVDIHPPLTRGFTVTTRTCQIAPRVNHPDVRTGDRGVDVAMGVGGDGGEARGVAGEEWRIKPI